MNRIAKFGKVSCKQFMSDYIDAFKLKPELYELALIEKTYNKINLPTRATKGSAGYDFKTPMDINLCPGETIKIPTGIRCQINDGWALKIYPRSGLGFKYRLQLDNTVGIIDNDYYESSNEGHIMIKTVEIKSGQGFAQGIFVEYGITVDDDVDVIRNGGFGSTN